jgi:hypothetical protein
MYLYLIKRNISVQETIWKTDDFIDTVKFLARSILLMFEWPRI